MEYTSRSNDFSVSNGHGRDVHYKYLRSDTEFKRLIRCNDDF